MQRSQLTNGELQDFMRSTMNDTTGLRLDDLNNTMARIWSKVYRRLEERRSQGAGDDRGLDERFKVQGYNYLQKPAETKSTCKTSTCL